MFSSLYKSARQKDYITINHTRHRSYFFLYSSFSLLLFSIPLSASIASSVEGHSSGVAKACKNVFYKVTGLTRGYLGHNGQEKKTFDNWTLKITGYTFLWKPEEQKELIHLLQSRMKPEDISNVMEDPLYFSNFYFRQYPDFKKKMEALDEYMGKSWVSAHFKRIIFAFNHGNEGDIAEVLQFLHSRLRQEILATELPNYLQDVFSEAVIKNVYAREDLARHMYDRFQQSPKAEMYQSQPNPNLQKQPVIIKSPESEHHFPYYRSSRLTL